MLVVFVRCIRVARGLVRSPLRILLVVEGPLEEEGRFSDGAKGGIVGITL